MSDDQRPISRTVMAYASGARLALFVQAAVAILALAAVVGSGFLVKRNIDLANQAKVERKTAIADLDKLKADREKAVKRLNKAVDLVNSASTAATLILRGDFDLAHATLDDAVGMIPLDEDSEDANERATWRRAAETLRTKQIELYEREKRYDEAIADLKDLQKFAADDRQPALKRDLARIYCRAGKPADAAALIDAAFRAEHADLLTDPDYLEACEGKPVQAAPAPAPARKRDAAPAAAPPEPAAPGKLANAAPAPAAAAPGSGEYAVVRAFLHIRAESQRAAAIDIANSLCAAGYVVPGIEQVSGAYPVDGQIRYYYRQQAADAGRALELASSAAAKAKWPGAFRSVLFARDGLPKERVEIWLPPKGGERAARADKSFRCAPAAATAQADVGRIVANLNVDDASVRVSAGQQAADLIRAEDSSGVAGALVAKLAPSQLDKLSANGRFNVLYLLNLRSSWKGDAHAAELEKALATIASDKTLGQQTRDCVDKLRAKLAGNPAPNRCGGR